MLNKFEIPNPDERAAKYRAENPAQQPLLIPSNMTSNLGYVQGALQAREFQLKQNQDVREQGMLDIAGHEDIRAERTSKMKDEAFGWEREDRARQQMIQKGMADSFQNGGYSGVIDFLQRHDPNMALDFTKKKLELDADIMKNEVMQTTVPTAKAEALAQGYGALGKMGVTLLRAPEEDRAAMYSHMLPMIKAVNPNAPDRLDNNAVTMFQLAAAQAMPANVLYSNQQQSLSAQTALGKIDADIRSRVQAGETPEASPSLKALMMAQQNETLKLQQANDKLNDIDYTDRAEQLRNAKDEAQANTAKYALSSSMTKNYRSEAKDYIDFSATKTQVDAAIDSIKKGSGSAGQTAAMRTIAMIFNKGQLGDSDVAAWANNDNDAQVTLKKLQSIAGGDGKVVLNPREIQKLQILMNTLGEAKDQQQMIINQRYRQKAQKYGVDVNDIGLYEPKAPDAYLDPSVPPDLAAQAKQAIQAGAPRDAVNARVRELMSKTTGG